MPKLLPLIEHAIKGLKAMPPKGGNPALSDVEVAGAVVHMANAAGANWKAPAAPAAAAAAPAGATERTGAQLVEASCGKCHTDGASGAPRIGDHNAWIQRAKRGLDSVYASALKGHAGMPARGGMAQFSDAEVKRAVEHMMNAGAATAVVPAATIPAAAPAVAAKADSAATQDLAIAVKEVQPFPYCAIAHQGTYTDMPAVIGQLVGAMQAQRLFPEIRGPMVGIYYNWPGDTEPQDLSWEAGFIVTAQATTQPPLMKKAWEHRTVAVAIHAGPYAKAGATIEKMTAWLAANGYESGGPVLERYLDQNPMGMKPVDLRTEIWIPVAKR